MRQAQDSTADQLDRLKKLVAFAGFGKELTMDEVKTVYQMANKHGLYDAADFVMAYHTMEWN